MTAFEIEQLNFTTDSIAEAGGRIPQFVNWPVVYLIEDGADIYVGETGNAERRMRQHLKSEKKQHLREVRVVLDDRFNASACLDLESFLIRLLDGDGRYKLLNLNEGVTNQAYYQRSEYNETFKEIFDELRDLGYFQRTIPQIENSDLFKLSPYKALNTEQGIAVLDIVDGLVEDLQSGTRTLSAVQGDPGTGKTIVGIYLMKLLRDLAEFDPKDDVDGDSMFSDLFIEGNRELFQGLRIGLVVPQKSLRKSITKVFRKAPALRGAQVLTPYEVADAEEDFDVIVVDEAHRLTQRGAQSHGTLTGRYGEITRRLFGEDDDYSINQLDWIRKRAQHTILLLDTAQSVRPIDIEPEVFERVITETRDQKRLYPLDTQMRVKGGKEYLEFAREVISDNPPTQMPDLGDYEFELFDDLGAMHYRIRERDAKYGLARLVAGYAWKWRSKNKSGEHDIELDGVALDWNVSDVDWIASKTSLEEVGSIHTVQGYDLNYAGVIVGGDLRIDPNTGKLVADRENYFDTKGKSNNSMRGQATSDEDLLRYITNVYRVLLTRGMRGTYLYITDTKLRARLRAMLRNTP
ncbi:DNA/RNA helicase domain-containing protein [Brachybacterium tyrofermentans]|uniref:DNA/RNA helicase domain-containing protein n=1 Tax=Brachybacterium tyrofermentans TaxID=47848 RepID=UPI003FD5CAF3